ncbi:MAG: arginine:pyruvate transaminase [Halieaceae bacterium]|jgi:arginine:pyruvate transaminase
MKYSEFTTRIAGDGAEAWKIHDRAVALQKDGRDIILLSLGEPDFDTPAVVVEAVIDSLRAGHTHYSEFVGIPALRQAIAEKHKTHTGQFVDAENVVVMAGAQNAMYAAVHCLVNPGDEVIIPEPTYVTYEAVLGAVGAIQVGVPMDPDRDFYLDPAEILAAVTAKTKAIILNSPHNPTGVCLTREQVSAIGEICLANDLWLVADEVYAALVFEDKHHSIASVPGLADRTVVISSLSKSHAMSGWRLGWLIGPKPLIEHISNMIIAMLYGTPTFIQHAGVTAITDGDKASEEMRDIYRARRDQVFERLNRVPGLRCRLPGGGMFMMIDVRESGYSGQQFSEYLLEHYGVSALAGEAFGANAAGHLRLSLGTSADILLEACERIDRCFTQLRSTR